jgi:hypothetical protein
MRLADKTKNLHERARLLEEWFRLAIDADAAEGGNGVESESLKYEGIM